LQKLDQEWLIAETGYKYQVGIGGDEIKNADSLGVGTSIAITKLIVFN
jgi:hypothetical protein